MGEDGKSGVPRWLVISTAVISLVAAILVAGAKYYEFHKARAEAAKATSGDDPPKRETPPPEKGAIPGSQPKPSEGGFTAGSVWDGYTDEPIGLKTRIVVDSCERGRFKGVMTPHQAGVVFRQDHGHDQCRRRGRIQDQAGGSVHGSEEADPLLLQRCRSGQRVSRAVDSGWGTERLFRDNTQVSC